MSLGVTEEQSSMEAADQPTKGGTPSLGKQVAQGAVWNYAAFLVSKGLLFVATLVLARLLSPADFGLVGMALLVITVLDILRDFGIGAAVIYFGREGPAAANLAFVLSSGVGVILCVANWVLAPLTVQFFKTSSSSDAATVTSLIQVLGLSLLFASLGSTHDALLQKEINYRRRMVPEVGRTLLKGLLSVGLAFAGFGAWSLVYGQVIGEAFATLLLWAVTGWRPSLVFRRELLRPMLGYSVQTMMAGGLGTLLSDVDYFIIGGMLGESALGIYTLAFRIPELLIKNLSSAVSTVAFPVAARLQSDLAAMRDVYLRMQHYMLMALAPLSFGLYATTPVLIHILFKPSWEPVIPIMQILSLYMLLGGIGHWPGVVYKAVGRPDIMNLLALVKVAMLVPVLLWSAANYGILGVAWGQLAVKIVGIMIDMVVVARFINITVWDNLQVIWPTMLAGTAMAAGVQAMSLLLDPAQRSIPVLALSILVGAAIYTVAIWLLDRAALTAVIDIARGFVRRKQLAGT